MYDQWPSKEMQIKFPFMTSEMRDNEYIDPISLRRFVLSNTFSNNQDIGKYRECNIKNLAIN